MVELAMTKLNETSAINLVYDESFDEGICGLVAGAIVNKTQKPTLILADKGDVLVGSGRSILGFDIYSFLKQQSTLFTKFGGHMAAVGLTIPKENISEFKNYLENNDITIIKPEIDVIRLNLNKLSLANLKKLNFLRPFGMGLPKPLFYLDEFEVLNYNLIKKVYPKWQLTALDKCEAISFDQSLAKPNPQALIGNLQINEFRGKETLSFIVKDLK